MQRRRSASRERASAGPAVEHRAHTEQRLVRHDRFAADELVLRGGREREVSEAEELVRAAEAGHRRESALALFAVLTLDGEPARAEGREEREVAQRPAERIER